MSFSTWGDRDGFHEEFSEDALYAEAESYAAGLSAGDEIHDAVDGDHIAPWRHLLPAMLAYRGLLIAPTTVEGTWVVLEARAA